MDTASIFASLRRNKVGTMLMALQIALTLAIVSNALTIVLDQFQRSQRPTGIDELNIASLTNTWTGHDLDLKSRLQTDLSALRALPEVVDAYATDGLPLRGGGYTTTVSRSPESHSGISSALYPVDDHAMRTLGIRLVGGRWFTSEDIVDRDPNLASPGEPRVAVVTRALAKRLFPDGNALGNTFYTAKKPISIVGIVERMQGPNASSHEDAIENAVMAPYLWADPSSLYVIRARPGQAAAAVQAAQHRLLEISHSRILSHVETFQETREHAYSPFRAMYTILSCVCTLLILVTGVGVVGLTTYWVGQRRRQIGIRRALGARRSHILRYIHLENLLIVGVGVVGGIVLAIVANVFVVHHLEVRRISGMYVLAGAMVVLILGQVSALWPALRAAAVPPASAARAT